MFQPRYFLMRPVLFIILFVLTGSLHANNPEFESVAAQVNKLSFIHASKAKDLVNDLHVIAKQNPGDSQLVPLSFYWESYLNYSQGISDPAIHAKIKTILKWYDAKSFPFENALLLHSLALNDVIIGNYTDALTNSLQALTQYKQNGNTLFKARALQLLGVVCYRTRNFGMSEKFSKESLSKASPKVEYYKSLINMYSAQVFIKGKSASAQQSLLRLLPVLAKIDDQGLLAVAYLNLGATYYYSNDADNAYVYFSKALDCNKQIGNKSFSVSLLVNASAYFTGKQDYKTAKKYIEDAEKIALHSNNTEQLSMVYYTMADLYDKLKDKDNAYFYLRKYNSLKETISNSSKTIDSYQTYVATFLKSAEKEVSIARRRYIITLVIAIAVILLAVSVLIIFLQKKRQQTLIKEAEKNALEKQLLHEKAIQQIHEEKHKELLDAKIREVTSYSLMLSNKNNVLQEVLQQTRQLKKMPDAAEQHLIRNMATVINDSLNKDQESNKFIHHFNEVHPDFFSKLKATCNGLTENNLRMCAYFKMGMSTKQVAAILNISIETVKNGRYRLKKKLGLNENDNLDDFIRTI